MAGARGVRQDVTLHVSPAAGLPFALHITRLFLDQVNPKHTVLEPRFALLTAGTTATHPLLVSTQAGRPHQEAAAACARRGGSPVFVILPVLPVTWLHCQPCSALPTIQSGIQQPRIALGFSHLPTAALCSAPCRRTTTRAPTPCRASASTRRSRATAGACGWCCCRTRATGTELGRACCTPCTSRCGPVSQCPRTPVMH